MGNIFDGNANKYKGAREVNEKGRELRVWVLE